MSNVGFRFKQFFVSHDRCAMKVGTDGVLLGAWSRVQQVDSVLDIGTGSGLVALMLAQRSSAHITALEIDENAAAQAAENVLNSPWSNRISVCACDFLSYHSTARFDLIVSNPPYFEHSLPSPDLHRTNARHTQCLNYESLLQHSARLLSPEGRICLILPFDKFALVEALAIRNQLFLTRTCIVRPTPDREPKRLLVEFSTVEIPLQVEELVIELTRHRYSDEYIALTKDFYLKM